MTDPFEEGWDAYEEGAEIRDNPYPEGTDDYNAWEEGYLSAEVDTGYNDNE